MKNNIVYIFLATIVLFANCDRVFENEVEDITPPELHVFVEDDNGSRVDGAQVTLFVSAEDFENKSNSLVNKTTDGAGKAIFTEAELSEPGIYYVWAEKDGKTNAASTTVTKYLLLNDGHTFLFTTIE